MKSLFVPLAVASLSIGAAHAEDWPHWRGLRRNDIVRESSGWEKGAWPPQKELWSANVGEGSTSPIVVAGRLYTLGWRKGQDTVSCLDAATGAAIWKQSYACPRYGRLATGDQGIYSGPSSTPEFDQETHFLFTLSIDGDLQCWNTAREGERVWGMNLHDRFDIPRRPQVGRSGRRDYGYTSSPLVHDDWLIVEVGASDGNLMAFDKRTGQRRWVSQAKSPAGHNGGPAPMQVEGVPCLAVHNHDGLLVVRLDQGQEGKTIATYPWQTSFANNIASASVHQNYVLLTSSYNHHKIAKLQIRLSGAKKLWEREEASGVCTPLVFEGHVYWAWRNLVCLDFETGETKWRGGRIGDPGSCVATTDGRLIIWSDQGDLTLVETVRRSPDRYQELASRKKLGRSDAWPHLVLCEGRLYCKDRGGRLICLGL